MGFDNECIPNIQSLPGEYFCPVCRLLVYPNEALQSQCSHLYCKPCLTYIVSTTRACPYDGYLVTEADSKPLIESNKAFAEAIGKIVVHCLYHRSGCTWQGPLSECTMHCSGCAFGNSPVVCNRCSIQIVHRQVQEHAQNCPGVQPQPQQIEGSQAAAAMGTTATGDQTQTTTQVGATTSQLGMTVSQVGTTASETQTSQTAAAPAQDPSQPVSSNSQVQAVSAAASTQEQWYQQYYQPYPGYDAYQQHYQQYYPYQQQAVQQYQQQPLQAHTPQMAGQHQAQVYMQPLAPQPQLSVQPQPQVQPQVLPQSQLQPFGQPQSRPPVPAPVVSQSQNQVQVNPLPQAQPTVLPHSQVPLQTHAPSQGPPHLQTQPSSQSYSNQHPPQHIQMPQYQQPNAQMKHLQTNFQPQAFSQLHPQHHPVSQTQALPQPQVQLHSQPHSLQPNLPLNPNVQSQTQQSSGHAVTGHLSYPQPQPHQQMQLGASQHAPMHPQGGPQFGLQRPVQAQYPQHTAHLRPPQSHAAMPNQQKPALLPSPGQALNGPSAQLQPFHLHAQQPAVHQRPGVQPVQQAMPQQYVQQQPFPSQPSGSFHNQLHLQVPSVQQQLPVQSQLRPQGPHQPIQQFPQQEQNVHSMQPHQPQNLTGPLMRPNHGLQVQPYQQSANVVQGRPMQLGPTQPSSGQSDALRTKNQVQVSSEQQSGATLKPMSEKPGDHMIDRSADEREAAALSGKASKKEINELNTASGFGNDATELKTLKLENDVNPVDEEVKSNAEIENKCTPIVTCAKEMPESEHVLGADPEAHAAENVEPVTKHIAKEEAPVSTEKLGEHSVLDDKKIQDVPLRKPSPLQEAEHLEEHGGRLQKDKTLSQMQGVTQGPGFHPSAQMQVGGVITDQGRHQSAVNHGTCTFQQRPDVPLQGPPGPPPHLQAAGQLPTQFRPHEPGRVFHVGKPLITHGPDVPPSGTPAAAPASMSGRGPSQYGLPQHGFEPQLVSSQLPSLAPTISSSALDSHGAMTARAPPHGPESQLGPVTNPAEGESFRNQRSGCMDGGKPDSLRPVSMELGPLGQPSGMYSSAFGLKDERFKPLPDKCSDPFLVEPARHVIDRGEFEGNVKQFPRSSHLDVEPVPKFGPYFSSSRPLDSSPHGFSMDVPPRAHEKGLHGLNFDTGSKLDHMAGSVHSRFLPPYNDSGVRPVVLREDDKGRSETAHFHPDFLGPVPGFGRRHMDALNPRSPNREYSGISSHGFGGLEDIDGREQHHFGFSSHFRRGEFEGPGNFRMGEHMRTGGLFGPDVLPSHARRGEHLGPRGMPGHPRLGEPVGFGAFQGHARMGEAGGPGNIRHPRLGEPGFRSSYSLQGYPNDGIYTGDTESFESSRKRKPVSMGWCRICNVDCETVEGLDVHSQTREHQKRAMDMVLIIKQNAKKHKPDYASLDGASKPRNANFEGRGNKN